MKTMPQDSSAPFDQGLFLVHLNRGKELFDKRHFSEAVEELEEARRMRPFDENVLNLLGLVYFKNERYREADKIYGQLIEVNSDSDTLHFNQALVCFKLGHLDRAEAAFLRALELSPKNQKANFYLGNIYEKKKQYYNAIFQYRKAGANIMVRRVQAKIDAERAAEAAGEGITSTEETKPPSRTRKVKPPLPPEEKEAPPAESPPEEAPEAPPAEEPKITVDHIDKTRFLTALRLKPITSFPEPKPTAEEIPPSEARPPSAESNLYEDTPPPASEPPLPEPPPSPPGPTVSEQPDSIPAEGTVVELTEPMIPDAALSEMTRGKVLSDATENLFSSDAPPEAGGSPSESEEDDTVEIPSPVEKLGSRHLEQVPPPPKAAYDDDDEADTTRLYTRLRRRDDIFRFLENNLMEVNFSGKVFIKQGTIYSYIGNLTFWVKPQRAESVSPLVIVSGTGKLILSDRQREISVMDINGEEVYVEPSHLLACQETLMPRYALIKKKGDDRSRFQVLAIKGTGMIALSVATSPLLLKVTSDYPVNVSSANIISWSGNLTPSIVDDEALTDLMFPHSRQSVNLRLEGTGKVMMEKLHG